MQSHTSTQTYDRAKAGLWRDHPATPRQLSLAFEESLKPSRFTQGQLLIEQLRAKRAQGEPLALSDIMKMGVAQHGARFHEIRERGFVVENETERGPDGRTLSWYWLRRDPERDGRP